MDNQQTPERPRGVNSAPTKEQAGPWTFLILGLALVGGTYYLSVEYGPHVPWQIAKAAIGLGLVIFLHELGHFAVAKWCDVHVEAFSLGFGPAIPGLSFRKGETLYKIAWIPLGGYVKMVGEGSENEEDDTDPRSFKNKTVGQRMAIISAGVVMNVILGCVCFILAYQGGIKQNPAIIDVVEPGSPAWKHAVRRGQVIEHIGDVDHPYFKDLRFEVMLSREGQELRMVVVRPGPNEKSREFWITPRRDDTDGQPVIGIAPPPTPKLVAKRHVPRNVPPVYGSARAARALALQPGDVVIAASDPDDSEQLAPLSTRKEAGEKRTDYEALCRRFLDFSGKPVTIEVSRANGSAERVHLDACGVEFGDLIIGTTDPNQRGGYDPYQTTPLPDDVRNPGHPNYFVFSERMQRLAGKPVVLEMRRQSQKESARPVAVLVPPAFHQTIPGLRMKMGKVKAVRGGAAAETAGVQPGDRIREVELTDGERIFRAVRQLSNKELPSNVTERVLDPVRLPFDLRQWAGAGTNVKATITVARDNSEQHKDGESKRLEPVQWDASWRFDREVPLALAAPMSIPELGVAYQVETLVDKVEAGSPAAAELQEGDVILAVALKDVSNENSDGWGSETKLYQKKNDREPWWARVAWIYQDPDVKAIRLKILRGTDEHEVKLDLASDETWPLSLADRGLRLMPDERLQKADGPLQAVALGLRETREIIVKTYLSLRSMITNRVSATKNLKGPITIALAAFAFAGESFADFMFFLAIISVNLAVINFLPIPVLDGGHMVFLIYEKLRGRPATEQVRLALTYVGVLLILSLMVFVIFLDVKGIWFSG